MRNLPRTDIDSFFRHEWQISSAVRPEWSVDDPSVPLFREAYFGRCALAEPVRGRPEGPPYVVCTYPNDDYIHALDKVITIQEEITIAYSRSEAEKAVRRYDRQQSADENLTLFDHD